MSEKVILTKEQAKAVCGISDTVGTDSLSDRLPV